MSFSLLMSTKPYQSSGKCTCSDRIRDTTKILPNKLGRGWMPSNCCNCALSSASKARMIFSFVYARAYCNPLRLDASGIRQLLSWIAAYPVESLGSCARIRWINCRTLSFCCAQAAAIATFTQPLDTWIQDCKSPIGR